ncbi:MAG: pyrroline-5-carboxylate reductase [Anaerolineae bacterium]|nr:pyrroline-5-carboxylate reductase [Anaerolineae bacterium]
MNETTPASFANMKVGIIGSGVMGEAMIGGLLSHHVLTADQIVASDALPSRAAELRDQYKIQASTDNCAAAEGADVLVLSIKPQTLDKVLHELHHGLTMQPKVVLSIIAGASIQQISEGMGNPNIVRSMPNTPARIGQGITVWTAAPNVPDVQREHARTLLRTFGQEVFVDDEHYLDMATALSGSGPAYVFLFMEAMIDAGVHMGFPRRIAEQLVIQTVRGSVEYAAATSEHPATLRNQVTSPGGTSAEALYHLEKGGLRTVVSRAIWAAYQRSVSLGAGQKVSHSPKVRNPDDLDHGR